MQEKERGTGGIEGTGTERGTEITVIATVTATETARTLIPAESTEKETETEKGETETERGATETERGIGGTETVIGKERGTEGIAQEETTGDREGWFDNYGG